MYRSTFITIAYTHFAINHRILYLNKKGDEQMSYGVGGVGAGNCGPAYPVAGVGSCGSVGGLGTGLGIILVLFILLVIISRSWWC
jgi:hypothetical protein